MSERDMKRQIRQLRQEVFQLRRELQDAEHTHELRSLSEAVMKKEISDLQRQQQFSKVDVAYVRQVLISAFESGELPKQGQILTVLARLLQFAPEDLARIQPAGKRRSGLVSVLSSVAQTSKAGTPSKGHPPR